jgi:hypothetical protein
MGRGMKEKESFEKGKPMIAGQNERETQAIAELLRNNHTDLRWSFLHVRKLLKQLG